MILGLGLATLVSGGAPCLVIKDGLRGVRIAGVLLEAGRVHSSALLQWGTAEHKRLRGECSSDPQSYSFMHDLFARVGGPTSPADYQVRGVDASGCEWMRVDGWTGMDDEVGAEARRIFV